MKGPENEIRRKAIVRTTLEALYAFTHFLAYQLYNRLVVVLINVKEAKVAGVISNGLVLAATSIDATSVELIDPPAGSIAGDKVFIDGVSGKPFPAAKVKKLKLWESVKTELITNNEGLACWRGLPMLTQAGFCRSASLSNVPII